MQSSNNTTFQQSVQAIEFLEKWRAKKKRLPAPIYHKSIGLMKFLCGVMQIEIPDRRDFGTGNSFFDYLEAQLVEAKLLKRLD